MPADTEIILDAYISRDKLSKSASITIGFSGEWLLYKGTSVKTIDYDTPILEGKKKGTYPLKIDNSYRAYFYLKTPKGFTILSERHLPMAGAFNFRDLGGIKTKSGQHVKWGKLFRADDMSQLTDEDLRYLASIPLRSVVDFRGRAEARRTPDRIPNTVRFTYPIAITPGNIRSEGVQVNMLKMDGKAHMQHMNRLLVSDPECVRAFKTLFTIMQNGLSAPLMFHCSAGKDRTGMATALILFALGVDEKTIMEDYLSSQKYLEDKYAAFVEKHPRAEALFTAKKKYIKAGLDQIKKDHGNIMTFITNVLKVDIEKFRRMYLIEK